MNGTERSGIAVYGTVLVDKINVLDRYPSEGELSPIFSVEEALGGAVPNVAQDLKKLSPSLPVYAGGRIGKDKDGELVLKTLGAAGIDTSAIVEDSKNGTSFTQVMSVKGGQRTFFTYSGASNEYGLEDVKLDSCPAKIFHLGYLLLLDKMDSSDGVTVLKEAKKRGMITSVDLVSKPSDNLNNVINCLPYVDYLIINEYEAGMLTGKKPTDENLRSMCEELRRLGVCLGVIIHKADMSVMLTDGGFTALGSLILPKGYIKGSTGAGDAFCAGALLGILRGLSDLEILEAASSVAAVSLFNQDATSAIRPLEEIFKLTEAMERKKICL